MRSDQRDNTGRTPSVSGPGMGASRPSVPPDVDGYEIVHPLGEGGMGVVYLARQRQPIQCQVALKVVKAGMDTKQVIARFEAEEQALALLDHPNVAQVYDAGTTKDGHPYFSMEYVSGPSITEYCDRHKLTIYERLRLFQQICLAVHHAHQKGIIHRDLKPSNILVSAENDQPIPKIIDFGVAKATSQPLTERTLVTEDSHLVGLADLYVRQAQFGEAEPLLLQELRRRETQLGPEHPYTVDSLKQLVTLYESWNKPDEAGKWRAKLAEANADAQ